MLPCARCIARLNWNDSYLSIAAWYTAVDAKKGRETYRATIRSARGIPVAGRSEAESRELDAAIQRSGGNLPVVVSTRRDETRPNGDWRRSGNRPRRGEPFERRLARRDWRRWPGGRLTAAAQAGGRTLARGAHVLPPAVAAASAMFPWARRSATAAWPRTLPTTAILLAGTAVAQIGARGADSMAADSQTTALATTWCRRLLTISHTAGSTTLEVQGPLALIGNAGWVTCV